MDPTFRLLIRVRVQAVEEFGRVGALDVDLAQRRHVHDPDRSARRRTLAEHGLLHVLSRAWEVPGALPLANVLEQSAVLLVPAVQRGDPDRIVQRAPIPPGQGGEGERHIRRPVGGGPNLGQCHPERVGDHRRGQHARGLALVLGRADGGVALDVFHRAQAGARGPKHVRHGTVALEVHEVRRPSQHRAAAAPARACADRQAGSLPGWQAARASRRPGDRRGVPPPFRPRPHPSGCRPATERLWPTPPPPAPALRTPARRRQGRGRSAAGPATG
jgi:hypothetical protein